MSLAEWVVVAGGAVVLILAAIPVPVWTRMVDRAADRRAPVSPHAVVAVACIHRNGRGHAAPRDRLGWHLCRRGDHFQITPPEDHQL